MMRISAISASRVRGVNVVPLSPIGAGTDEPRAREEEMADIRPAVAEGPIPAGLASLVARPPRPDCRDARARPRGHGLVAGRHAGPGEGGPMKSAISQFSPQQMAAWIAEQRHRDPVRYQAWVTMTAFFVEMGRDPNIVRCPPVRGLLASLGGMLVQRFPYTDDPAVIFAEFEPAFQRKRARRPRADLLTTWIAEQVRKHGDGITAGQIRDLLAAELERMAQHPWIKNPGRYDGSVVYLCRGKEREVSQAGMNARLSRARGKWRQSRGC